MEGDDADTLEGIGGEIISIHSLRMEGDAIGNTEMVEYRISIHSLRMEGDRWILLNGMEQHHFNPLPPHGGRLARC